MHSGICTDRVAHITKNVADGSYNMGTSQNKRGPSGRVSGSDKPDNDSGCMVETQKENRQAAMAMQGSLVDDRQGYGLKEGSTFRLHAHVPVFFNGTISLTL